MIIELNKLAKEIYEGNKLRGFDVRKDNLGQVLMLIVSELAEALEADRNNRYANIEAYESCVNADDIFEKDREEYIKRSFEINIKNSFEDEIADTLIRILDLCGAINLNIERHVNLKLKYNATREYMHGKRY